MNKIALLTSMICVGFSSTTWAQEEPVRIGLLFGFTGPIESMAPEIAASAELALEEAARSTLFLGGRSIESIRADSTCVDVDRAVAAAERLVTADGIHALIGADCSGAATAVLHNVTMPHGIISISPAATSPALTDISDNGLFFRTAPSDARQGEVLAKVLLKHGIQTVAVTYTDNDYGKGLASSFEDAYLARGGSISIVLPHSDGKGDYTAEVATLDASGAEVLLVAGYADQGGRAIVQASLDLGAFDRFVFPDGMVAESLIDTFGDSLNGAIGTLPGRTDDASIAFENMLKEKGISGQAPYRAEAYDAAAVLVLAMQAAGTTSSFDVADAMTRVANAPGVPIGSGEIAKGLEILIQGGDIDYVGASSVELTPKGDATGSFREVVFSEEGFETVGLW